MISHRARNSRGNRLILIFYIGLIVLFPIVVLATARWRGERADSKNRESLVVKASAIARAVHADQMNELTFTAEDMGSPVYHRVCRQLKEYVGTTDLRGIYTMVKRDGELFFGPESYRPGDPHASDPGKKYPSAPRELFQIFEDGQPFSVGPYKDEYGIFVSAFAPVVDPPTGDILAVVGVDVEHADWKRTVEQSQYLGGSIAAVCYLVMVFSLLFLGNLGEDRDSISLWGSVSPVICTFLACLIVSFPIAVVVHDFETDFNLGRLRKIKETMSRRLLQSLSEVRNFAVPIMKGFHKYQNSITHQEFSGFSNGLLHRNGIEVVFSAIRTHKSTSDLIEQAAAEAGLPGFSITGLESPNGDRLPGLIDKVCPVWQISELETNQSMIGLDLFSNAGFKEAIDEVFETGQTVVVSEFQPPFSNEEEGGKKNLFVFFPVDEQEVHETELFRLSCIKVCADKLLRSLYSEETRSSFDLEISLRWAAPGSSDRIIAALASPKKPSASSYTVKSYEFPVFFAGRTLLLSIGEFQYASSLRMTILAVFFLGLCSFFVTLFSGFVSARRLVLEDIIRARTRRLETRESLLANSLETLRAGGWHWEFEPNLIFWSEEIFRLHGLEPNYGGLVAEERIHKSIECYQQPGRAKLEAAIKRCREAGEPYNLELGFVSYSGRHLWVRATGRALIRDGLIIGLTGILVDETWRVEAEEERLNLIEQLQHSQKLESLGRLAGGVAHDLNNMLTPVLGHVELLCEDHPDGETRESLNEILKAVNRAKGVVSQLLTLSRKEALNFVAIDLNAIVTSLEDFFRKTLREKITLQVLLFHDPLVIHADPARLETSVMNLVVNAVDAMPDGGTLTLETSQSTGYELIAGSDCSNYAVLAVSDTGTGMTPEVKSHIFEPFYTTKPFGKGTGLGLSCVMGIVDQHCGRILVESEAGFGTTFRLYFPVKDLPIQSEDVICSEQNVRGNEQILVVDNEPLVIKPIQRILAGLGYRVMVSDSADSALYLIEASGPKCSPDLLVTDLRLPGDSGRQLYEKLLGRFPSLRVLYMSGDKNDLLACGDVRIAEVCLLKKPFTKTELAQKVRAVLDLGREV